MRLCFILHEASFNTAPRMQISQLRLMFRAFSSMLCASLLFKCEGLFFIFNIPLFVEFLA